MIMPSIHVPTYRESKNNIDLFKGDVLFTYPSMPLQSKMFFHYYRGQIDGILLIWKMGTFLIGFQFMQGSAAITRHGVTRKTKIKISKAYRKAVQIDPTEKSAQMQILHIASGRSLMYGWKSVLELLCQKPYTSNFSDFFIIYRKYRIFASLLFLKENNSLYTFLKVIHTPKKYEKT